MDTYAFSSFADRHSAPWFMYGWTEYHTPNLKGGHATAEEINNRLLIWLKNNARRDDYFLYINYWDVHRPYKMPAQWARCLEDCPIPMQWPDEDTINEHQIIKGPFTAQQQFPNGVSPYPLMPGSVSSRKDFEHLVDGYDASIVYADYHIQQVLEELDAQGVLENSAVIITADHGDAFGEHGIYSDHVCADNCIQNIPLIVKWPAMNGASRCDGLVVNTDLAPTICDLLDFPIPAEWDGSSFKNCLSGNAEPGREHIIWDCGLYAIQRAVRTKSHLLIRTYDNYGYPFKPVELYDMQEDIYQTRDISSEQPSLVDSLSSRTVEWIQQQSLKGPIDDPLFRILRDRLS